MKLSATCALLGLLFLAVFDSAGGKFIYFSRKWTHLVIGEALCAFCLLTPLMSEARSEIGETLASFYKKDKLA